MIIVLRSGSPPEQIEEVKSHVVDLGYDPRVIEGVKRTVIGAVGDELSHRSLEALRSMKAVENVLPIQKRYKLASREFHAANTVVEVAGHPIGGDHFQVIAGPCSVESRPQMVQVVEDLTKAGVHLVRGGVYKPRTSPYAFQGLADEGLDILQQIKAEYGVGVVTEVLGVAQIPSLAEVADAIQIGARNSQNYYLLAKVAQAGRPVLLKRGMASTVEEWLSGAEYLIVNGCTDVILCERGIRTFGTATRNTLDLSAVVVAKQETHLPVVVDPSHAAGVAEYVGPLCMAAIAAGADGLLIEAHPDPVEALSDAAQQIPSPEMREMMKAFRPLVELMGKHME